jgi:N-methylhydantoinase A
VDWDAATAVFAGLERDALAVAIATGADVDQLSVRRLADMRYVGQGSEITVVLPETPDERAVRAVFEASYRALFSRTPPGAAIQFVALRLALIAPMPGAGNALRLAHVPARWTPVRRQEHAQTNESMAPAVDPAAALKGRREVYFSSAGGTTRTPVYDRYALPVGTRIAGPAVFEENESTFVIGPGSSAIVMPDGSIVTEMPNDGGG